MKGRGGPPSTLHGAPSPHTVCPPPGSCGRHTWRGLSGQGRKGSLEWASRERGAEPGPQGSSQGNEPTCSPHPTWSPPRHSANAAHYSLGNERRGSGTRRNIFPPLPLGSPRPRPTSSPSLPPALWRPPQGARLDPCLYSMAARGSARQTPAPSLNPLTRVGGTEHDGPGSVAVTGGLSASRQQRRQRRSAQGLAPWEPLAPMSLWRV